MWYYYICVLSIIFLWFILVIIVSEQIQKSLFVDIFTTRFMKLWLERLFAPQKFFQLMQFSDLKPKSSNEKLKVLEVGVGDGTNFEFYPPNCNLTVLEYNEYFEKKFNQNVTKFSKITLDKFVVGLVEDMHEFEDNTFDVVLCTHVLSSVSNVPEGLNEIKRVLKQGGKFFFVEHVAYQSSGAVSEIWLMVQHLIEPLWKIVMGGSSLTKQTGAYIENAGFKTVKLTREYPQHLPLIFRPHIWGYAEK